MRKSLEERFWEKVDKSAGTDGCWPWTGSLDRYGYGKIKRHGARVQTGTHRISYELCIGPIPEGLCVCHRCDVPACVNPAHLFLGTRSDNTRDMVSKKRDSRHTHPERYPRGDEHQARKHPEYLARGEKHWCAKLTETQVREIRFRYEHGETNKSELGRQYKVRPSVIHNIIQRHIWKHVLAEAVRG
jgi:hypothetical protein